MIVLVASLVARVLCALLFCFVGPGYQRLSGIVVMILLVIQVIVSILTLDHKNPFSVFCIFLLTLVCSEMVYQNQMIDASVIDSDTLPLSIVTSRECSKFGSVFGVVLADFLGFEIDIYSDTVLILNSLMSSMFVISMLSLYEYRAYANIIPIGSSDDEIEEEEMTEQPVEAYRVDRKWSTSGVLKIVHREYYHLMLYPFVFYSLEVGVLNACELAAIFATSFFLGSHACMEMNSRTRESEWNVFVVSNMMLFVSSRIEPRLDQFLSVYVIYELSMGANKWDYWFVFQLKRKLSRVRDENIQGHIHRRVLLMKVLATLLVIIVFLGVFSWFEPGVFRYDAFFYWCYVNVMIQAVSALRFV